MKLLEIMKQSPYFNEAEYRMIAGRFEGKTLYLKLLEMYDYIFEKENKKVLEKRGMK